jgi:hypothetical protein
MIEKNINEGLKNWVDYLEAFFEAGLPLPFAAFLEAGLLFPFPFSLSCGLAFQIPARTFL